MIFFVFQTRHQLEKLLDWENSHLYHKLGLHWKLARQRCDSTLMMEYVSLENIQGFHEGHFSEFAYSRKFHLDIYIFGALFCAYATFQMMTVNLFIFRYS